MVGLLKIIENGFSSLPTPARVVAYFVILSLIIFLMIAPRYITGQVVAETRSGGYVPYRGVDLQTRIGGPTMKYKTNSDGDWAIPVVSSIPGGTITVQVFHEDSGSWFDVPITWTNTWRALRGESFRITIKNNPPNVTIAAIQNTQITFFDKLAGAIIPTAKAAQLSLPKEVIEHTSVPSNGQKADIEKSVIDAYREVVGKPDINPTLDWKINRQSELTYVDRIQLIQNLEKKYDLIIPDEHWQSMTTLNELADYLVKRKFLEKIDPQKYKVKSSRGWADIDTALPAEQRPSFK